MLLPRKITHRATIWIGSGKSGVQPNRSSRPAMIQETNGPMIAVTGMRILSHDLTSSRPPASARSLAISGFLSSTSARLDTRTIRVMAVYAQPSHQSRRPAARKSTPSIRIVVTTKRMAARHGNPVISFVLDGVFDCGSIFSSRRLEEFVSRWITSGGSILVSISIII